MSVSPIVPYAKSIFGDKPVNILEIGARYGESAEILMHDLNVNKYVIVDPYTEYNDYRIDGFNQIIGNDKDDTIFNNVKTKLTNLNKNTVFHRTFSNDINTLNSLPNNGFDLIFIDGNHTYKYVLEDLENYYPKLARGGILCGDDFFMRTHENNVLKTDAGYDEPMVYEAVLQFCKNNNKTYAEFGRHASYGKVYMINV